MKLIFYSLFLFLFAFGKAIGQEFIVLGNNDGFVTDQPFDTLKFEGVNSVQLMPDSLRLDIDCDGFNDLGIFGYLTPHQFFPPYQNFKIIRLTNEEIEVLSSGSMAIGYRNQDTIYIEQNSYWKEIDEIKIATYSDPTGPLWPIENSFDSVKISNVYLVFRIKKENNFHYGWIKFDGLVGTLTLIIKEVAIQETGCNDSSNIDSVINKKMIKVSPNPTNGEIKIFSNIEKEEYYSWNLINMDGSILKSGILNNLQDPIHFNDSANGMFLFELFSSKHNYYSWVVINR